MLPAVFDKGAEEAFGCVGRVQIFAGIPDFPVLPKPRKMRQMRRAEPANDVVHLRDFPQPKIPHAVNLNFISTPGQFRDRMASNKSG